MYICCLCKKTSISSKNLLCNLCSHFFRNHSIKKTRGVKSLYPYSPQMRSLILQSKVGCEQRSLKCLIELMVNHPLTQQLSSHADYIMPAPSSVLSRWRGKIDIAWFLAHTLSTNHSKKFKKAPFKFFWSLKKQSYKKRISQEFDCSSFVQTNPECPSLLIIDDVFTTGFTLNKLCWDLEANYNLDLLTLSYARDDLITEPKN